MKKILSVPAAYLVSCGIIGLTIKLAGSINEQAVLRRAGGLSPEMESLRLTAAQCVISLATPIMAGIICGLIFTLLARPRIVLHAALFGLAVAVIAVASAVEQYQNSDIVLILFVQLLFPAALIASAAVGKKIASALAKNENI